MALEDKDCVCLWSKGQACVLPIKKDSGSLSSGFLSSNAGVTWRSFCHLDLFMSSCGSKKSNQAKTPTVSLATAITMSPKVLCSDPGDLCLVPASMEP